MLPSITSSRAGRPADDRARNSNYFILVSTNKRPETDEQAEALVNDLADATDEVWTSPEHLSRIIKFNRVDSGLSNPAPPWHDFYSGVIQDINMQHAPEVGRGAYGHAVHDHIALRINHTSNITIKNSVPEIINAYFATRRLDRWGITNLYVSIHLARDPMAAYLKYIQKDYGRYAIRPSSSAPIEYQFVPYVPPVSR